MDRWQTDKFDHWVINKVLFLFVWGACLEGTVICLGHYLIAQAGLPFSIILPQFLEFCNYRHTPLHALPTHLYASLPTYLFYILPRIRKTNKTS